MSKPGRRPKPTALRLIDGNPGKRPINLDEPQPDLFDECPDPPRFLSPEAAAHWELVGPRLARLHLLSEIDGDAFAVYCEAFATWVDAMEKVRSSGSVVIAPRSGMPIQSPFLSVANTAAEKMMKIQSEFGMTPSSRSRLAVPTPKKPDDSKEAQARNLLQKR